jgi:hypothetical protein
VSVTGIGPQRSVVVAKARELVAVARRYGYRPEELTAIIEQVSVELSWTVAVPGGPPSQPVTLPAGAYLPAVRGTDAGLLLQVPRGLALWNPGSMPRILPSSPGFADGF